MSKSYEHVVNNIGSLLKDPDTHSLSNLELTVSEKHELVRSSDVLEKATAKSSTSQTKVSQNLPPVTTGNQVLRIPTYGTPEHQGKTFKRHSNTVSKSGPGKEKIAEF